MFQSQMLITEIQMNSFNFSESTRQDLVKQFGTWFAKEATPSQTAAKCAARLTQIEEWKNNLTILQKEQEVLVLQQKKADMKKTVSSMTAEEKAEMILLLNS